MKMQIKIFVFMLSLLLLSSVVSAQQKITVVTPLTEVAEGLDLYAVAEIFRDFKSLEEFEEALNDPDVGVNNLDFDRDGYVDYIRVVEQVTEYKHLIILQAPFRYNEYQDIATIEIEKNGNRDYQMRIRGSALFYGPDYYVSFGIVRDYHWPIISWIFGPFYRPYRSAFYFGYYPHWWRPYRHVPVFDYHRRNAEHGRGEAYHRNRPHRFINPHEGDHRHFDDQRHENKNYSDPEPDRSDRYSNRQPAQRHERGTANPRMRTPNQKDGNRELNKTTRPDVRKDENIRRETRESTRPSIMKPPSSRNEDGKISRQKVEKRSTVANDSRIAAKEKRRSSR